MPILPPDAYDLYDLEKTKQRIRQSIDMNTTSNLFYFFYDRSRLICIRYAEDPHFRREMGQGYLEQSYVDAMVTKDLINQRPLGEKLKLFRELQQHLSEMASGKFYDGLEKVVVPNPFNTSTLCRPWGTISEEKRLKFTAEQRERIDDFTMTFLG